MRVRMRVRVRILSLLLLFLVTSCSPKGDYVRIDTKAMETDRYATVNEGEVRVFTMYSEDINPNDDIFSSPVAQEITRRSGIKLDIEYPVSDVSERVGIMIASGDYPDFVMVKETDRFVDAGAYIDLEPLIKDYAPNLQKLYEKDWERLRYSEDNPAVYVLSSTPIGEVKKEPSMGFMLQHAVVKELGYPTLRTVEDFEEAIKAYIQKYPKIKGQETIGVSLCADDWRWHINIGNSAGFATGLPDDGTWYIDPETYEASYRFLRKEEKEYYRWLNHMYDIGLIDPDSFVQKYDAYLAKIASGRVIGLIDAYWEYSGAEQVLRGRGEFERTYGMYPIQLDETTIAADFRDAGYQAGYGIGITKNCEDPIAAIRFLDFLASEEGQILRSWGIEGIHYSIDEKGKRVISDEEMYQRVNDENYTKDTGVGAYIYPFPSYGSGVLDSTGNPYRVETFENMIESYSDIEKEVLEAYGAKTWGELYPSAEEVKKSDWGAAWNIPIPEYTGVSATLDACNAIMKEKIIEAIISDPMSFDVIWESAMKELENIGVYEMNAKFTELVKARVKSWKE